MADRHRAGARVEERRGLGRHAQRVELLGGRVAARELGGPLRARLADPDRELRVGQPHVAVDGERSGSAISPSPPSQPRSASAGSSRRSGVSLGFGSAAGSRSDGLKMPLSRISRSSAREAAT